MKIYYFLFFLTCYSCSTVKNTGSVVGNCGRLDIEILSDTNDYRLKGIVSMASDSSNFDIFGPLGISLAKIRVMRDSIFIVDIQNKKIYKSFYLNLSDYIYNLFNGNFSKDEERFIYAMYTILNKGGNVEYLNAKVENDGIVYGYSGTNKKMKKISFNLKEVGNSINLKYVPNSNDKVNFSDISKYSKFETVSIKL